MVTTVNRRQPVVTAGLNPKAAYSRVISVNFEVPADGVWYFAATPGVGQRFWLLEVQVWCFPRPHGPAQSMAFEVRTGQAMPPVGGDIEEWDNVLPLYMPAGGMSPWSFDVGRDYFSWRMKRLYTAVPRRLGIRARKSVGHDDSGIYASFEISEG